MKIALIVMAVVSVAPALSGGEVYKNQLAAEKALGMATDVKVGWGSHCVRRGGKSFAFFATREYDMDGDLVADGWTQGLSKEERMKLAKSLKPDTDKGGTTIYSSETEIIPAGSRRIPYWR